MSDPTLKSHQPTMKRLALILSGAIGIGGFTACSNQQLVRVKPYERGNLAKPIMADNMDPILKSMTEHAYFSREASFGGGGVGGGGCGCN